jgi:hypothetical protein
LTVHDPLYNRETVIQTTIGQLNFFRWIIHNQVYEYALVKCDSIEKEMNQSIQKRYLKRDSKDTKVPVGSFKVSFL